MGASESKSSLEVMEEKTLDRLFEMDPVELSTQDEDRIVAEYRKRRLEWKQEDSAAKSQGRRAKTSKGVAVSEQLGIELDIGSLLDKKADE